MEFVALEIHELRVEFGVEDAFVSQDLLDVQQAPCFCVFHCGFPVAEGVECYLIYAFAGEFVSHSFSLALVRSCGESKRAAECFRLGLGKAVHHWDQLFAGLQYAWFVALFRGLH